MSVTIKQIAERAGLSVPTVSRILNNDSELFRPETRDKVLLAARELGYRPNSYRMALRTKRFNAIGLLFGPRQVEGTVVGSLMRALLGELHEKNQHLLVGEVSADPTRQDEAAAPKMLREWSVDGMLMHCDETPPAVVQKLIADNKVPAVWFNCRRESDCVYTEDREGVRDATERLLRVGHRNVAFFDLDGGTDSADTERRAGYTAAVEAAGGKPLAIVSARRVAQADRLDHLIEWLRAHKGNLPTAAVCSGHGEATALFAAALSSGLSVPRDLSIIAVHDEPVDDAGRRITTMCLPSSEMAVQGLAALLEKIGNPAKAVPSRGLPLTYCEGSTLAPPGGN